MGWYFVDFVKVPMFGMLYARMGNGVPHPSIYYFWVKKTEISGRILTRDTRVLGTP